MKQVNWGIIGCGNVTEKKSGPAFNKVANSRLVAVMRRDAEKAADYAKRHGVPKWYSDADALINDNEVNAVYVATPPKYHAVYAIKAMRAGKAVYVEKPMAMNEAECREMIAVSHETKQPLFVAYYRRAIPYFVEIKRLIDEGAVGEVKMVQLKFHSPAKPEELNPGMMKGWRVDPSISGGGHFHDMASHQLDYLTYILGPVKTVNGISKNTAGLYEADDTVLAMMEFESGVLFSGSWCFTVPNNLATDQTEIIGTKGKLIFSFFGEPVITLEKLDFIPEQIVIPYPEHVQQPFIECMVRQLLGGANAPSNGETGVVSTVLMDKITKK